MTTPPEGRVAREILAVELANLESLPLVTLQVNHLTLMLIIMEIQLACRMEGDNPGRRTAEQFARGIQAIHFPAGSILGVVLDQGWNPDYDIVGAVAKEKADG